MNQPTPGLVLITGANGYVGSRLARHLIKNNFRVRCMTRRLQDRDPNFIPQAEWVEGDAFNQQSLHRVLEGVEIVYYLIHSMGSDQEFSALDRQAAHNFVSAIKGTTVQRVIYLGGLGERSQLSKHLQSRQEVGEILRGASCSVIELRASIIIGPGSISFELIRSLVERLPIMITPKWVHIKTQPIFIDDVIAYLTQAMNISCEPCQIFEIGGNEVVSYGELMQAYAKQRNLYRIIIPVPLLQPRLSSLWLQLVTPLYARIGRKLIDSLTSKTTVKNENAKNYFSIVPTSIAEALKKADEEELEGYLSVHWFNVDSIVSHAKLYPNVASYGRRLFHSEQRSTKVPIELVFRVISEIGGERGWYYADFLWKLRAIIDKFFGGVGLRKGRRDPLYLHPGDTVDFWRVEKIIENELLILYAEMRVPGRAWLQFELQVDNDTTHLCQTATFDPKGLFGICYWYLLYPMHVVIFKGMASAIIKQAETASEHFSQTREE